MTMEDDVARVSAPAAGDLLAERYSLSAHVNDDSSGRQVWRGVDILLNRAVTVVLRIPGGSEAAEMLSAAVAASRVNHPNIVGVYDAVDQGDCAYIVREWVEGQSLRDALEVAPLPAQNAVDIIQCAASAVAAVHESGVAHGNVHPGTILLSVDDRVVLADPRADAAATQTGDVRALGATLYCAITGGWPRTVPGPASLPDAPADLQGRPFPAAEIVPDLPAGLDELLQRLLDGAVAPPTAAALVKELEALARPEEAVGPGALDLVPPEDDDAPSSLSSHTSGRRLAFGAAALVGLALAGLLAAMFLIPSEGGSAENAGSESDAEEPATETEEPGGGSEPTRVDLPADAVQVVDPGGEDSSAKNDVGALVDGVVGEGWRTSHYYNNQAWGNLKNGMGLLIDLGEEQELVLAELKQGLAGSTVALYVGGADMAQQAAADRQWSPEDAELLAEPQADLPLDATFNLPTDAPPTRYLLIWCELPAPSADADEYAWAVNEIDIYVN